MIIRLLNTSGTELGNVAAPIAILTNIISWAVNESGANNANRIAAFERYKIFANEYLSFEMVVFD